MKLYREMLALVLVLVALFVVSLNPKSVEAQAVNPGLTVASLKAGCLSSGAVGAPKVYKRAIFVFFEQGSIGAGAKSLGISTREFGRQVVFGARELERCLRQRIAVSSQ